MIWLLLACNGGAVTPTDDSPVDSEDTHTETGDTGPDTSDTDTAPPEDTSVEFQGPPRVVLFIGDGMGTEHIAGAGLYVNGEAGTLRMESLPVQGRLRTASLDGLTDSAASGTAMATGVKTTNSRLGMTREGDVVQNALELASSLGLSTGVITTDNLWGATPSSFLVHEPSRYDGGAVSRAIALALPDLLFGGGGGLLAPELETLDIQGLATREELLALEPDGRPLVGLFQQDTFPYVADGYAETIPTLAEMTQAALTLLEGDEDGFVLIVEGARIDHASHARMSDKVLQEVAALDEAVGVALDWAAEREEATILVTADHECGGLSLTGEEVNGLPGVDFREGEHTNSDVAVFAQGPRTTKLHEARLDNTWVHAVLVGAITDTEVVAPNPGVVVDGFLDDLGAVVVTQKHTSDFGHGHNQLDGLRVSSDAEGLRFGVDGVFEDRNNMPMLLVDLDFGEATGFGRDEPPNDHNGELDTALSNMGLDLQVEGLGFELAIGGWEAHPLRVNDLRSGWGARGVGAPFLEPGNIFWLHSILNWDDGNVARDHEVARDAGDPGETLHGWEVLVPWPDLFQGPKALELAVVAVLVNREGDWASNQTLPPLPSSGVEGSNPIAISRVVRMSVDGTGTGSAVHLYPE